MPKKVLPRIPQSNQNESSFSQRLGFIEAHLFGFGTYFQKVDEATYQFGYYSTTITHPIWEFSFSISKSKFALNFKTRQRHINGFHRSPPLTSFKILRKAFKC